MSRLRSSSWLSNYYLGKYGASSYPYHSYPFAYGGALRISPYLSPVPTLFVAAPSGAYGAASAELDWTDVRLSGAADEGYLCETASEAVKVINEFLNDKWAHLPNVQIIFSGLASDPDNVWEFKDGSVLPFSQVRERLEIRNYTAMKIVCVGLYPNALSLSLSALLPFDIRPRTRRLVFVLYCICY